MTTSRRVGMLAIALVILPALAWAAEPAQVRVLTYNIHHGEGSDGRLDLPRIAAVIQSLRPDVVALQEVDRETTRTGGVDQAAELGRLTGMHAVFGRAMDYAGGQYGEAILARTEPAEVTVHDLPFTPGHEPRAALAATIRLDEGLEFRFVGTHLEHADASLRLAQARRLHEVLLGEKATTTVLAGDLNAVPGSPPMEVFGQDWTDATAGSPAPTCPADRPTVKIDYVLFRPAGAWRVVETRVVEEPVASDHRPLLVVLQRQP